MPEIASTEIGKTDNPIVIFAHGWDRTRSDFIPVAELISGSAHAVLLDLPGFGDSPRPNKAWGTEQYAQFLKEFIITKLGHKRFIWVGHSFGGRIGLRMASMEDSPIDHLVIVAGAGVKKPVPWWKSIRARFRAQVFKLRRARTTTDAELQELEKNYGSSDYVRSRETGMRDIFLKTINEDQSENAKLVACPTTLIYGAKDSETPPAIGLILNTLIPDSQYIECPVYDHLSIITRGRHQIALAIKEATEGRIK